MHLRSYSKIALRQWRGGRALKLSGYSLPARSFHASARALVIKPFLLADIGEGIRECEVIQWFVEPEARVEEFDKLCEVQSDKASVEITSRFAGVIKKLHYEAGEMAKVGKPLVDIDIQGEIKQEDLAALNEGEASLAEVADTQAPIPEAEPTPETPPVQEKASPPKGKHASLATPAVRHLTKELDVAIEDVQGTGRDGRVLKEDVYQFAKNRDTNPSSSPTPTSTSTSQPQFETPTPLTNTQHQMFKTMTKSLTIPHFLYAQEIDFTSLSSLRSRLNTSLQTTPLNGVSKISYLPFIIKALSLTLLQYPILNARLSLPENEKEKPTLIYRENHNIGIAIDSPLGLLVPVIKSVQNLSILEIASELTRLQSLASTSSLTSSDLSSGTITVSNIGSIGGTYVSPVIVENQLAILGIGKVRSVPAFDGEGRVVRREVGNFSWSADHRVVDGATMARAGECVRGSVEGVEGMVLRLR